MQTAIRIASKAIVISLFLFWVNCGLIFSASKVGFNEMDIGMPLLRILFFIIQIKKLQLIFRANVGADNLTPKCNSKSGNGDN